MSHELTRRSFFRGVVATVAATSLVVEATPDEVAAFSPGTKVEGFSILPVKIDPQPILYVRDVNGQYVPFATVTALHLSRERMDETRAGDDVRRDHLRALKSTGEFEVIGPLIRTTQEDGTRLYNNYPLRVLGNKVW